MGDQSNPRKVTTCGGMTVVSLSKEILDEARLELGERVVADADDGVIVLKQVEYHVTAGEEGGGD